MADISRLFPSIDLARLEDKDQKAIKELLEYIDSTGDLSVLDNLFLKDYDEIPVTPAQFIDSYYYVGPYSKSLYPTWKKEISYVLDPKNEITEWIIYGSIGSGKTTAACIAQLYKLYLLGCMKDPQSMFGLATHLPMYFAFFSVTKGKAEDAINAKFQSMLNLSPFFRDKLPKNTHKIFMSGAASLFGPGYREHPKKEDLYELDLPHNIHLLFGSQTSHALSLDVFSATLDEMNFRSKKSIKEEEDENSARSLYQQVRTRIESRFRDDVGMPGLVINISSARSHDSFVEQRIEEVRRDGVPGVHISDFALWDVKVGKYSKEKFRVFVGSGHRSSRILVPGEEVQDMRHDEQVIDVPETFRDSFETNLDAAIRDLAGIATAAVGRLFKERESILSCEGKYPNALFPETVEVGLKNDAEVEDFFDVELVTRYDNIKRHLLYYPDVRRFIHVDLAKNADCVGITSLCIPYFYEKKGPHIDSNVVPITQRLPFVFVDFICRIKAPVMDEISFDKVRQFIVWIRDNVGYPVTRVTYDSWQSIHSIQLLQENNFEAETLSVDKTDTPYMELLAAFTTRRIMYPKHEVFQKELRELQHDITARSGRVDHPRGGSKDCADAVAGAYANALAYIHKHGFLSVGAALVTEKAIESVYKSSPRELKAKKLSKEMGFKETVHIPSGYDGKFYGGSKTGL